MLTPELGAASLAWGMIALQTWQVDEIAGREQLPARQSSRGDWEDSPYATASAVLALQDFGARLFEEN